MNKTGLIIGIVMFAMCISVETEANGQLLSGRRGPIYAGTDVNGMTMTNYDSRIRLPRTAKMAAHNTFSPARLYTYSNPGVLAGRTHTWNQEQANCNAWHGDYMNWKWREPTALVVPPTSSYITNYAWGVGQVRSTPIHHQFGLDNAGTITVGSEGTFQQTPYWPSSTEQFGIYPVRAPW